MILMLTNVFWLKDDEIVDPGLDGEPCDDGDVSGKAGEAALAASDEGTINKHRSKETT